MLQVAMLWSGNFLLGFFFFFSLCLNLRAQAIDPNIIHAKLRLDANIGSVPLYFDGEISEDLIFQNSLLHPEEAFELFQDKKVKDLSLLNPQSSKVFTQSSSIYDWQDKFPKDSFKKLEGELGVLEYQSKEGKYADLYQFISKTKSGRVIRVGFGPRAINRLMNASLFHKIGYHVPAYRYEESIEIRFADASEKKIFVADVYLGLQDKALNSTLEEIKKIEDSLDGKEPNKLDLINASSMQNAFLEILVHDFEKMEEGSKESVFLKQKFKEYLGEFASAFDDSLFDNSNVLRLKSVFVTEPPVYFLDPASYITAASMGSKRKYRSLVLGYALTDFPGSLNLFSANIGNVLNRKLYLDFIAARNYATPYADARWIARRIAQLTESDFEEIARSSNLCECEVLLLAEILKSRRNSMMEKLNLDFPPLRVNTKLSCGDKIVEKGILIRKYCETYPYRLTHDRYSGLGVSSDIWALIKSLAFSNLLQNAFYRLSKLIPKTNISDEIYKHRVDQSAKQFAEFLTTGQVSDINFGVKPIPFWNAQLAYSKDLYLGPILGTQNNIQVVESFNFGLGIGNYLYFNGLETPEILSGSINAGLSFNLSHVQPVQITKLPIEGREDEVEGAIKQALDKQTSDLFSILSLPLDSFPDLTEDTSLNTINPITASGLQLKATYYAIKKIDPELVKDLEKTIKAFSSYSDSSETRALADEFIDWYKVLQKKHPKFSDLQFAEQELLAANDPSLVTKKFNLFMLRTQVLKDLRSLKSDLSKVEDLTLTEYIESFFDRFKVGDSLISHISYDLGASLSPGLFLASNASFFLDLEAQKLSLYRTHMHRIDSEKLQIYRSIADKDIFGYLTGLRLYFRFLYFGNELSTTEVETRKYNIRLAKVKKDKQSLYSNDPQILGKLKAIRKLFFTGSLDEVKKYSQALRVEHKAHESVSQFRLLFWKSDAVATTHDLSVFAPGEEQQDVFRYTEASRSGMNWQDLFLDYSNVYIREHTDEDIRINIVGNNDPGNTFFGFSNFREASLEGVLNDYDDGFDRRCMSIRYRWNKLLVDTQEVRESLADFQTKFGLPIDFVRRSLRTSRFEKLSFVGEFYLFEPAFEHVLNLDKKKYLEMIKEYYLPKNRFPLDSNRQKEYEKRIKNNLTRRFLALQDSKSSMDSRLVMESLARLIMYAEKHFTPIGFFDFIGGLDNVYFLSRLEAYRKGEESTAPVIQFDSYGHQPDSRYICPLNQISGKYDFSRAELLLYWLQERL